MQNECRPYVFLKTVHHYINYSKWINSAYTDNEHTWPRSNDTNIPLRRRYLTWKRLKYCRSLTTLMNGCPKLNEIRRRNTITEWWNWLGPQTNPITKMLKLTGHRSPLTGLPWCCLLALSDKKPFSARCFWKRKSTRKRARWSQGVIFLLLPSTMATQRIWTQSAWLSQKMTRSEEIRITNVTKIRRQISIQMSIWNCHSTGQSIGSGARLCCQAFLAFFLPHWPASGGKSNHLFIASPWSIVQTFPRTSDFSLSFLYKKNSDLQAANLSDSRSVLLFRVVEVGINRWIRGPWFLSSVMAAASTAFESWLCSRLQQLELDEEVFSGYITGILDQEDTSAEDNVEALVEILGEATVRCSHIQCIVNL